MTQHRIQRSLSAVGLVALVLGVLMVIAPSAGAEAQDPETVCTTYGYDEAGAKWEGNPDQDWQAPEEFFGVGFEDATAEWHKVDSDDDDATDAVQINWKGTTVGVDLIAIVQGTVGTDAFQLPGAVGTGSFLYLLDDDLSNFTLCAGEDAEPRTLEVNKIVTGNVAPTGEWSFDFSRSDDEGTDPDFALTKTAPTTGATDVGSDAVTVAELDAEGATGTSVTCVGAQSFTPAANGMSVQVTVAEGGAAKCTFTNTYQSTTPGPTPTPTPTPTPESASLQIVKEVTGGGAPDTWTYAFGGDLSATVTNAGPSHTFGDLDAGTYTVNEVDARRLVDIDCGAADAVETASGATVTLDEGEQARCTFTNDYPEPQVLPDEVVPDEPQPPAPEPPQVLPDVVTPDVLPRTGSEGSGLAGAGALLVVFGVALVAGSRRLATAIAP